jgi:hypothetical protein
MLRVEGATGKAEQVSVDLSCHSRTMAKRDVLPPLFYNKVGTRQDASGIAQGRNWIEL